MTCHFSMQHLHLWLNCLYEIQFDNIRIVPNSSKTFINSVNLSLLINSISINIRQLSFQLINEIYLLVLFKSCKSRMEFRNSRYSQKVISKSSFHLLIQMANHFLSIHINRLKTLIPTAFYQIKEFITQLFKRKIHTVFLLKHIILEVLLSRLDLLRKWFQRFKQLRSLLQEPSHFL